LSGCAAPVSDALPPLKKYPPEIQSRAADELDALPEGSVLAQFMADYAVLRAQIKALHQRVPVGEE
jgi:hypothetical protein